MSSSFAEQLRQETVAVKLSFSPWFGVGRQLTKAQKEAQATLWGAKAKMLTSGKKILDTEDEAFQEVNGVRSQARTFWTGPITVPFPEDGIRLLNINKQAEFEHEISEYRNQLLAAVQKLENNYQSLKNKVRTDLGQLWNQLDYPDSLLGHFVMELSYPSVTPDERLKTLNPAIYERECARVAAKFDEAITMQEQMLAVELAERVEHLAAKVQEVGMDWKRFGPQAISNLNEFLDRYKSLSVKSSSQLDQLVSQARLVVNGLTTKDLKDNGQLRAVVKAALDRVSNELDASVILTSRRRLVVPPAPVVAPIQEPSNEVLSAAV